MTSLSRLHVHRKSVHAAAQHSDCEIFEVMSHRFPASAENRAVPVRKSADTPYSAIQCVASAWSRW